MGTVLLWLLWLVAIDLMLALAAGFAGSLVPIGDSLAVFRVPLAAAAVLALIPILFLAPQHGWFALPAAALAVALAAPAAASYFGAEAPAGPPGLVLYQKNLNFRSGDLARIAEDIRATRADVVTLQEVSARNQALLGLLRVDYPVQAYCPFASVGGTAVLSRLAAAEGSTGPVCDPAGGMTALELEGPAGRFWAVSIHLHWPWPHGQAPQARRLEPALAALAGPVVLGGDFNMVPWGNSVARVARAARVQLAGPTRSTYGLFDGLLPLPIDQVMAPQAWRGVRTLRPPLGSDHRGLLLRVWPRGPAG